MTPLYRIHVIHVPGVDSARDRIVSTLVSEAGACIHEDPERNGVMWNYLRALKCATEDETPWSVILSDDALPLVGWKEELALAIRYSPSPLLSLGYLGSYGLKAHQKGAPYGVGRNLVWGVGNAYRKDFLTLFESWAQPVVAKTGYPHDDRLAASFCEKIGILPAVTARAIFSLANAPSLVGHGGHLKMLPALTIESPGHPWSQRKRFAKVSASWYPQMEKLVQTEVVGIPAGRVREVAGG